MHAEIFHWFKEILKKNHPELFDSEKILECGSLNINGTVKPFFNYKEYIGVDWQPGREVTCVSLIHEYKDKPDGYFDLIVSTEMFEHDPYWQKSLKRMVDLCGVGGSLILTMATGQREPHELDCAPINNYYQNIVPSKFVRLLKNQAEFELIEPHCPQNREDFFLLAKDKK